MQIYIVNEKAFEYNDEYYFETDGSTAIKAFRDKKNATKEKNRLNKERLQNNPLHTEDETIKEYYTVSSIEVAENETESYEEAVKRAEEEDKNLKGMVREVFDKELKELFNSYPKLKDLSWTQYTPYFNDGDTCYFGVHDLHVNSKDNEDSDWEDGIEYKKDKESFETAALSFWQKFRQEDLQYMFGEGRVVVTREGTEVEEFDHD